MTLWITGLSGTGKTTLCCALGQQLKPVCPQLIILDGDAIRALFDNDLGYAEADRMKQIKRMQRLAQLLSRQGQVVLVAALYSHPELLAWNRVHLAGYFELYLQGSLPFLQTRDGKRLYQEAAAGTRQHVVGMDIPWHVPSAADLVIDAETAPSPEESARQVIAAVPQLKALFATRY